MAGRTTATTGWPAPAAAARASMPACDGTARWSADSAPISAASSAPPLGASSSAWSRDAEPEPRRLLQDAARLRRAEHAALAEDVGESRPALGATPGQLLLEQVADVGLRAVRAGPELRRDRVGAEPRRQDLDRALLAELVGDLEQAELGRRGRGRSRTSPRSSSCRGPASRRASAGRARASSSSVAARVAATVDRMPPPAWRISR